MREDTWIPGLSSSSFGEDSKIDFVGDFGKWMPACIPAELRQKTLRVLGVTRNTSKRLLNGHQFPRVVKFGRIFILFL